MVIKNVKQLCVRKGLELIESGNKEFEISADTFKVILTKILGIIRENGLYSFFVWLEERGAGKKLEKEETKAARLIYLTCLNLLLTKELSIFNNRLQNKKLDNKKIISNWSEITKMINDEFFEKDNFTPDELFFISEIYELFLTYALYKAKAETKMKNQDGDTNG